MKALERELAIMRDNCACGGDDAAVDEAEEEYKKLVEIKDAAINLAKVNSRRNTEIAMNRLINILSSNV